MPLGVVGNISAWIVTRGSSVATSFAIALTGKMVLYKPSEYATMTDLEIARPALCEAGVPYDAFITLVGDGSGRGVDGAAIDGYPSLAPTPPAHRASPAPWARAW